MNPISIVGAGPGALDLMTIRAQQRLKSADVLVWTDSLIPTPVSYTHLTLPTIYSV